MERWAQLDWIDLVETSLAGLGTGSLMALTGVAFVVIYKATRVINLAIGEMMMIGAFVFYGFAAGFQLPFWLALPLTLLVSAVVGGVIERTMIRPLLKDNPVSVFMVTIGLTSILIGMVELIWTAEPRRLPEFLPQAPIFIGEALVPAKTGYSFLIAAAGIAVMLLVFAFWRGGVALRATATDRAAASSVGINVPGVFAFSWMVAAMVAALAGVHFGLRREGLTVLDLGCGRGVAALALAAANPSWTVIGIDSMPAHVSEAREIAAEAGLDNLRFLEADIGAIDAAAGASPHRRAGGGSRQRRPQR